MRIATLNITGRSPIWHDRLAGIVSSWTAIDADVLVLQEVCTDAGDQAIELAHRLGLEHVESVEGSQSAGGSGGVAILSRIPLTRIREEVLPPSSPPRNALMASVDMDEQTLTLVCGHTATDGAPRSMIDRRASCRDGFPAAIASGRR